jgi:hypothetical protein
MTQYIYLLQEREFIQTKQSIFKIGKTKQENLKRILNYPNGSILICQVRVTDCDFSEKFFYTIFSKLQSSQKSSSS